MDKTLFAKKRNLLEFEVLLNDLYQMMKVQANVSSSHSFPMRINANYQDALFNMSAFDQTK